VCIWSRNGSASRPARTAACRCRQTKQNVAPIWPRPRPMTRSVPAEASTLMHVRALGPGRLQSLQKHYPLSRHFRHLGAACFSNQDTCGQLEFFTRAFQLVLGILPRFSPAQPRLQSLCACNYEAVHIPHGRSKSAPVRIVDARGSYCQTPDALRLTKAPTRSCTLMQVRSFLGASEWGRVQPRNKCLIYDARKYSSRPMDVVRGGIEACTTHSGLGLAEHRCWEQYPSGYTFYERHSSRPWQTLQVIDIIWPASLEA
jgi:hypothetical protein